MRPPTRLTGPHRKMHALLVDMGFLVEDEVSVLQYTLDCYVRELHVGVEYDGPLHDRPKQRAHDRARDAALLAEGIPVFRTKTLTDFPERFIDWVEDHCLNVEDRRRCLSVQI